jgi:hypothetical protein
MTDEQQPAAVPQPDQPAAAPAAAPVTREEANAEVRQQIAGQDELGGQTALQDARPGDVAQQMADAGAGATSVDVVALLEQLQKLQASVEAMQAERDAERKAAAVPGLIHAVKTLHADLTHRSGADGTGLLDEAVSRAAELLEAAETAVDSGVTDKVHALAGSLAAHLDRIASQAAHVDVSYARQLAGEDVTRAAATLTPGNGG